MKFTPVITLKMPKTNKRRRKQDVEGHTRRTINTYFVAMHKELTLRYQEYESNVVRIAAMARDPFDRH